MLDLYIFFVSVTELTANLEHIETTLLIDQYMELEEEQWIPSEEAILQLQNSDVCIYLGTENEEWISDTISEITEVKSLNLLNELNGYLVETEENHFVFEAILEECNSDCEEHIHPDDCDCGCNAHIHPDDCDCGYNAHISSYEHDTHIHTDDCDHDMHIHTDDCNHSYHIHSHDCNHDHDTHGIHFEQQFIIDSASAITIFMTELDTSSSSQYHLNYVTYMSYLE